MSNFVYHHTDLDGFCSAAIIKNELIPFDPFAEWEKYFFMYSHGWNVYFPEEESVHPGDKVYIVDLALDDAVMSIIEWFVDHECKVIHIDHHIGGIKYYETLDEDRKKLYDDNVISFHDTSVSATMLCWVYACMTEEERHNPSEVKYDFQDDWSHFMFDPDDKSKPIREPNIPDVVRYTDDNDIWRHAFPKSRLFVIGFRLLSKEDRQPWSEWWSNILYEVTPRMTEEVIAKGSICKEFQDGLFEAVRKKAFEYDVYGTKAIVLNWPMGGSDVFGDLYYQYSLAIVYGYDGKIGKWRYSMYSSDGKVDCCDLARKYFHGGGHPTASGGILDYNFFDDNLFKND